MDDDPDVSEDVRQPADQPPAEHPAGHENEVLLDSPGQVAALLAQEPSGPGDADDGAPWADGPDRATEEELPEPFPPGPDAQAGQDRDEEELLPMPVEGVGDLVADPLSRAKVVARDDPGGPAPEEVPPSPS